LASTSISTFLQPVHIQASARASGSAKAPHIRTLVGQNENMSSVKSLFFWFGAMNPNPMNPTSNAQHSTLEKPPWG